MSWPYDPELPVSVNLAPPPEAGKRAKGASGGVFKI